MDDNQQLNSCINSLVTADDSVIAKTPLVGNGWRVDGYKNKKLADLYYKFLDEGFGVSLNYGVNNVCDITQLLCRVYMAKFPQTIPLQLTPLVETEEEIVTSTAPNFPGDFYVNKGQQIIGYTIKNVTSSSDLKAIQEFVGRLALTPTSIGLDGWQFYCNKPAGTLLRLNIQPQGLMDPTRLLQIKSECVFAHISDIYVEPFSLTVNFYVHSKILKPLYKITSIHRRTVFKRPNHA